MAAVERRPVDGRMAAVERRPVDGRMAAVEHRRDVVWGCGLRLRFPLVYMYMQILVAMGIQWGHGLSECSVYWGQWCQISWNIKVLSKIN